MKKILFAVVLIACSVVTNAQFRIGAKGGLSLTNQYRKDAKGYTQYDTKSHTEFQAGFIGEARLSENMYLQPQLLYSRKGSTHSSKTGPATSVKMSYAELPVILMYKKEVPFATVFAGAGPVFGYAFSGELVQNKQTKKMFSDDIKNFKHNELSANVTAGVELSSGLFASLSYQKGFSDIYKADEVTISNNSLALTVGYFLKKRK